jgi:predicted dehydrogenase
MKDHSSRKWRIVGINFDHMHMGDLLQMVAQHPEAEIAGIADESVERMRWSIDQLGIPDDRVYSDWSRCLEQTRPDLVILCPATAEHALWVERVVPYGADIFVEKPFASSLAEADRMVAATRQANKRLIINWPLRWYPSHATAKRLVDDGLIGEVLQIHYYDGNRGPLRHGPDKIETKAGEKSRSWFYQRGKGGGSLLDYLGYGATLGTWFMNGRKPLEVTAVVDEPAGLEVDEHSITVARYETGLSKFETRWGTFTDPWITQPQPKCGFVLVGTKGTISSYDLEPTIRVQTAAESAGVEISVDRLEPPYQNPIQYVIDRTERELPVEGPLDPIICRIGQQIVDSAIESARQKRTVPLMR